MKTFMAIAAASLVLTAGAASAEETWMLPGANGPRQPAAVVPPTPAQVERDRTSYGTGYHGRTTRTGGPVGGLPNRD